MRLTPDHIACLRVLARLGDQGCLTQTLALKAGGDRSSSWAYNRMRTLERHSLVVRRTDIVADRWFITDAGRDGLAALGGADGV